MIYLDNSSTTKPKKEVIDVMMNYYTEKWLNPSSKYGMEIQHDIYNARKVIADYMHCDTNEIYFTSSGSESNNWAIQGFVRQCKRDKVNSILITSNVEHHSILECAANTVVGERRIVHVDDRGLIKFAELEKYLKEYGNRGRYRVLVSIQSANNEIGTEQYIHGIAKVCNKYDNVYYHCDMTQDFGKRYIDVNMLDSHIDMITASGHKIGCPRGMAILYIRESTRISPLIYGSQERSMRGGTENVAGIMGFAKAIELYQQHDFEANKHIVTLWNYTMDKLKESGLNFKLNGLPIQRLHTNISITFDDIIAGNLIELLEVEDIFCSAKSACMTGTKDYSHVLKAIGLNKNEIDRTLRIGIGQDTTKEDIDKLVEEICKIKMIEG